MFIEEEFIQAGHYIDFLDSNMQVTSVFFSNESVLLGAKIERACKHLIELVDPTLPRGNMGDYKSGILSFYPKITEFRTFLKNSELVFSPFAAWKEEKGSLEWWEAYTKEKHGTQKSTMRNCLEMLSAFEILLYIIHAEEIRNPASIIDDKSYVKYSPLEFPKLMETRFICRCEMSTGFFISYDSTQYRGNNIDGLCAQHGLKL